MSQAPSTDESHETTDLEDAPASATCHSPAGNDTESFQVGQHSSPSKTTWAHGSEPKQSAEAAAASGSEPGNTRHTIWRAAHASHAYRHILNGTIHGATGDGDEPLDELPGSLIGASYWAPREKEILFQSLTKVGPHDSRRLASAIVTKSAAEVCIYLRLLQQGAAKVGTLPPLSRSYPVSAADVPAAHELSAGCENALNAAAEALAHKVATCDARLERKKYGDGWRIDEEVADSIEEQIAAAHSEAQDDLDVVDEYDQSRASQAESLLRPQTFLQLSRNLFMNGPPGTGANWRDIKSANKDVNGPAIFRTAFEDFHNLAVSFTRRLVQAVLFQSLSRLRASDASRSNWQPKPEVRGVDVSAAVDVLNLRTGWNVYWATLPRRCGLELYTEDRRFMDGRPSTKTGVKLTYDEVEEELRLTTAPPPDGEASLHLSDIDSDELTDAESSENLQLNEVETDDEDDSDSAVKSNEHEPDLPEHEDLVRPKYEELDGSEDNKPGESTEYRKRKRALSPISFARAEDRYLEFIDRRAAWQEECSLRKRLGMSSPAGYDEALPERPLLRSSDAQPSSQWWEQLEYETEWEAHEESMAAEEFEDMNLRGKAGKRQRLHLREKLRAGPQTQTSQTQTDLALGSTDEH
ncbi:hypothetical protein BAUCODRAFT_122392 [Baudoinia panamericana UAMH 10762]|uniref:Myb-like domain-containing protein n=1 Tax=Baudoinia panamericana (strain UAMH 10762) TaxID=717646 RepID=M2MI90_BAUPA|nr:uncharacterized protein BAUCODRAFT_122392 [Baudoinia panamericana UAMH 10762]EMC96386.1 hypothetical protein BAUCODRAFT_122392 [Baudoinia panamericana UAMH 10762]